MVCDKLLRTHGYLLQTSAGARLIFAWLLSLHELLDSAQRGAVRRETMQTRSNKGKRARGARDDAVQEEDLAAMSHRNIVLLFFFAAADRLRGLVGCAGEASSRWSASEILVVIWVQRPEPTTRAAVHQRSLGLHLAHHVPSGPCRGRRIAVEGTCASGACAHCRSLHQQRHEGLVARSGHDWRQFSVGAPLLGACFRINTGASVCRTTSPVPSDQCSARADPVPERWWRPCGGEILVDSLHVRHGCIGSRCLRRGVDHPGQAIAHR